MDPVLEHIVAPGLGALYIGGWHWVKVAVLTGFIQRSTTRSHPLHLSLELLDLWGRARKPDRTKRSLEFVGNVLS